MYRIIKDSIMKELIYKYILKVRYFKVDNIIINFGFLEILGSSIGE